MCASSTCSKPCTPRPGLETVAGMNSSRTPLWASTDLDRFVDHHGRHLLLRGINLGGDCKVPYPDGGTENPSDFSDHRQVSFVNRPFPLGEADEHFTRLRHWGFNTLRFLVTWEAVSHAGPGQYDSAYLDYIVAVLERALAHRFIVFIDFHQDVWSRMSGGSGAPGWTFEALGLDLGALPSADAALVMQHHFDYDSPEDHQAAYPMMSWASNYQRPANGIMWTAFFAGATFTPDWMVGGENVQRFLQRHYLGAMNALAERIAHLPNVVGFDTLNEPGLGWIGQSLSKRPLDFSRMRPGPVWTPLDGLRLAHGQHVQIPCVVRDAETMELRHGGERAFNARRVRVWLPGIEDPFAAHGAWRPAGDDGEALVEDFFQRHRGNPIRIADAIMAPFFNEVAQTIRRVRRDWLVFAELNPSATATGERFPAAMPAQWVNASHWYDIQSLRTKRAPTVSRSELVAHYRPELQALRDLGTGHTTPAPTLFGEFGIQFDLDDASAYRRWHAGETGPEIWDKHIPPLAAAFDVLDDLLASGTLWNYTASNRNDARIGDRWNQEDLSIYSRDQATTPGDPDSGGRAVDGFVRAYVVAAQGRLKHMRYDDECATLGFELDADPEIPMPTIVFLPRRRFTAIRITADAPIRWSFDAGGQCAEIWCSRAGSTRVEIVAQRVPS